MERSDEIHGPAPPAPDVLRYAPDVPLPPYRHLPGRTPHPSRDPAGHSFGVSHAPPPDLPAPMWRENAAYLAGVDRFNLGYFWEAHESWESVWQFARVRDPVQADFLRGFIQLAAAHLKRRLGETAGARTLAARAFRKLEAVASALPPSEDRYMGLDLRAYLRAAAPVFGGPEPGARRAEPSVAAERAVLMRLQP